MEEDDNEDNFDNESGVVAASNKVFLFLFHIENQEKVINTFCFLSLLGFSGAFFNRFVIAFVIHTK